jgi:hypothetical protein
MGWWCVQLYICQFEIDVERLFWTKIYRCYVVWQAVWVIVLPSMLWFSVAGQVLNTHSELHTLISSRRNWCVLDLQLFAHN